MTNVASSMLPHMYPMTQTYPHIHKPTPLNNRCSHDTSHTLPVVCSHCSFSLESPFINLYLENLTQCLRSKSNFTSSVKPPTSV